MLALPLLKTFPLTGRQLVIAEVASGAALLTLVQVFLFAAATVALAISPNPVPVSQSVRFGVMLAAPAALLVLNTTGLVMINATAVLFPSWMRLGQSGGGGIELIGQAMLTMVGTMLSMLVLLVVPAIATGVALALFGAPSVAGVAGAVLLGATCLAAETFGIATILGRSLERAEPSQIL
jgi:hypothetical protein